MGVNIKAKESPSQTAGPYVHIGCMPNFVGIEGVFDKDMGEGPLFPDIEDDRITISGYIYDGAGELVRDGMIEVWQADPDGQYSSEKGGAGWGRFGTSFESGEFRFDTVKPGPIDEGDLMQAPHLSLWITARGINIGLNTRLYFPDEDANSNDPILNMISDEDARATLIAKQDGSDFKFDIYLQGENETVFFDV